MCVCPIRLHPRKPLPRRGQAILLLLFGMIVALGFGALVWDLAMLSSYQRQLEVGLESAALSGASQLMDRSLLCTNLEQLELPVTGLPTGTPTLEQQAFLARQLAIAFAAENQLAAEPIDLADNETNDPDGDLVISLLADPTDLLSETTPWSGIGPANTLLVRSAHTEALGNPIALRFGRLLGLASVDLTVSAQASVDQQIYGFQPVDHATAPLFPLAVLPSGDAAAWLEQACADPVAGANDQYTVDPATDGVLPDSREVLGGAFAAEPDGVAEATLRIPPGGAATAPKLLTLDTTPLDQATLESQIVLGLSPDDLLPLGGHFSLDGMGMLDLAEPTSPDAAFLAAVCDAFRLIRGQKRVIPLGGLATAGDGSTVCRVTQFAAGRVVDCYTEMDGTLVLVIQPTLLQTATALVRSGQSPNPWIGKIVRTR